MKQFNDETLKIFDEFARKIVFWQAMFNEQVAKAEAKDGVPKLKCLLKPQERVVEETIQSIL